MKIRTLAIAGAMAVFSSGTPKAAKASDYDFWYAFQAGGLAMLCDLYTNGVISTNTVKEAKTNFTKPDPDTPSASTRDAIKVVLTNKYFNDCPISSP